MSNDVTLLSPPTNEPGRKEGSATQCKKLKRVEEMNKIKERKGRRKRKTSKGRNEKTGQESKVNVYTVNYFGSSSNAENNYSSAD